jgi:hypothetical protein
MGNTEYGSNNRWSGSLISGGGIYAAGTTEYISQKGSAATVIPTGTIKAAVGFYFAPGNSKQFSAGTYIGSGAATAAIKATGLTTVHHVFMTKYGSGYAAAATSRGRIIPSPVKAQGTVGSFYPTIFRTAATNKEIVFGTGSAGTYSWFAVGV